MVIRAHLLAALAALAVASPRCAATGETGQRIEERILACSPVAKYADAAVRRQQHETLNANVVPLAARKFCTHVDVLHSDSIFERYRNEALALQAESGKPIYTTAELYYFLSCKGSMAGWSPLDYAWARPVEDGNGNIHPNTFRMLETAGEYLALPGRNGMTLLERVESTIASYREQPNRDRKKVMFEEYRDRLRVILRQVEQRACHTVDTAKASKPSGG